MIAIGRQLRQLGFDVVISIAEPYAELAELAGLQANVVIRTEDFERAVSAPQVWKPIRGVKFVLRTIAERLLRPHFDLIQKLHREGETVLVAHPLDLAARTFRDIDPSTPLASIHLAPAILRTIHAPPRITPWPVEFHRPAWAVRSAYWLADRFGLDPTIAGPLNRLRAEHSLPPIKRVFHSWWLSPDRIIAMYPQWYAPATGTANYHCRPFFQQAADACTQLNHPGVLLSTRQENFPDELPPQVKTAGYLSLKRLLPRCAAIVHHGGIGTTSQALAAATPQMIRPLAFDQFDNATRVTALGCGRWLRRDRELTNALAACLGGQYDQACRAIADKIDSTPAVEIAAKAIRRMLA